MSKDQPIKVNSRAAKQTNATSKKSSQPAQTRNWVIDEYIYQEPISGCTFTIENDEKSSLWFLWYRPKEGGTYRFCADIECRSAKECAQLLGGDESENTEWENLRSRVPSLWNESGLLLHRNIIKLYRREPNNEKDIPCWIAIGELDV